MPHDRTEVRLLFLLTILLLGQALAQEPVRLTLMVGMTPQELADFRPALDAVDAAHPEFVVELEPVPQASFAERVNTRLVSGTLPDLVRVDGLSAQRWIRAGAFQELTSLDGFAETDVPDIFPGLLAPFRWADGLWGVPDTAAPDVLFYNKAMFDAAGVPYPAASWTYDDMREAAVRLTRDADGRTPLDADFDPESIVQWGWNGSLTFFWQRHLVQAFGADWCADPLCTTFEMDSPDVVRAAQWWADLVQVDHAGLYDPYSGAQTGIPGDPFLSGTAAMGYNGYFAVGQLNELGSIAYDVAQPLLGVDGRRHTPLSTFGYAVAATSEHPQETLALLTALTSTSFQADTWGAPGHAVPSRRSAADSVLDPDRAPANRAAILQAMEYGAIFHPFTPSAFEAYARSADLFTKMMRGDQPVASALTEIEDVLNDVLDGDRLP